MRPHLVTTTLLIVLLAGCQSTSSGPSSMASGDPLASAPPIRKGLDAQSLATLLTAEIAGQRNDFDRAARGYLETAGRYDSSALAERAVLAARYGNDKALLLQTAERWSELAPNNEAPARLLAGLAMERGDWQASLKQRLTLAAQGSQGDLIVFAETAIEENANLSPLRDTLARFLDDHPQQGDAIVATALLEAALGDTRQAQQRLVELSRTQPELPAVWLARGRIALEQGSVSAARDAAQKGLQIAPNDNRFILMLAQAQLRLGNVEAAEAGLDTLLERHPDAPQLRLALAQLYMEEDYNAPARRLLLPLLDADPTPPAAYILLGAIADDQDEVDNALLYYRQVPPGDGFLEARLRAAQMLIEAGRLLDARDFLDIERLRYPDMVSELTTIEVDLLEEQNLTGAAAQLLERQIRRNPDAVQLRFLRSMRRYEQGNLSGMESDLRAILEREPNNAMALNALGYTLVDVTERHEEGLELIQRAHELEPESPAILDSLGWAHHKLGDNQKALPYLQAAYAAQQDQEIAAHLAEVLWRLDRRQEARTIVIEALERFDERPKLEELIERIPGLAP
ncbi:tetratricopeptide repeat protein [Halomonas sp. PR-M31]|uniref:tetratricopeptide repeat protein n=1 Tax=Halomonas sp. PR-M31 TaxID=1471202 RepID=UPI0006513A88|nr:tetratricopeptide repeat protein [Halomonas sp. PR-M31]